MNEKQISGSRRKSRQELELLRDEALEAYLNREDFQYDLNGDALYRQYKDRYQDLGKTAMMDTMGQTAALTGGFGSSYAQTVGQQTYQQYLKELGDVVPELYQLAYDRYQDRGDRLYRAYEGWAQLEKEAADREQWQQNQQEQQRRFDLEYQQSQLQQQEQQRRWEQEQQTRQKQWDKEQQEAQRQFDLKYSLQQLERQDALDRYRQEQADKSEAETGAPQADYYAWLSYYQKQGKRPDSNDPTLVTKYDNQSVSTGDIMTMQRLLGIPENGMWTISARKAAGGLEADAAWTAYQKGQLQSRKSVGMGDMGVSTGNVKAMERMLGLKEDGAWSDDDAKATGGLSAQKAWEAYQKGLLRRSNR